jgi:DNA-binding NarL/FixJ family response regulator
MPRCATVPTRSASTILLVDDHPVVRESLALRIRQEQDLTVCADVSGYRSALDAVERHLPELVILDLNLTDGRGLELIREIKARWPKTRTLVFSMNDEAFYAQRSRRAGAGGYVMKSESPDKVMEAVRNVLAGRKGKCRCRLPE